MKQITDVKKKEIEAKSKINGDNKNEPTIAGIEWDVEEMKKKVDLAKIAITQEKNQAEKEAKIQEDKINDFEYQNKLLYLKLKEKEKEVHLADLKIKELKRNLIYKLTTIQNN